MQLFDSLKRSRYKNRNKIKIFALLLSAVTLMTGCASGEESEQIRLSFVHGWGSAARTNVLMRKYYEEFEENHKNIVLVSQPSSHAAIAVSKANDMLALDEMPNIVSTNGISYYLDNAVKRGKVLDFMPYIEADEELKASIHPSVFEMWETEDGALYTIPDALEVMGYWYNETYFIEAGITDDKGNVDLPENWEEFHEVLEKLSVWNQRTGKLLNVIALEQTQVIENLFPARLAGESMEGLQMVRKMPDDFDTGSFRNAVREFSNIYRYSNEVDNLSDARQYFIEGLTAMYFNGVWESEAIQNSDNREKISYANYPTNYGKTLAYVSPSSGYVVYNSPNERENEAAVEFVKYMLSENIQTKIGADTGQAPSNPNVNNQLISKNYPLLGEALEEAHDADIQIRTIASIWDNEAIQVISKNLKKASINDVKLEQMLLELNTLF